MISDVNNSWQVEKRQKAPAIYIKWWAINSEMGKKSLSDLSTEMPPDIHFFCMIQTQRLYSKVYVC